MKNKFGKRRWKVPYTDIKIEIPVTLSGVAKRNFCRFMVVRHDPKFAVQHYFSDIKVIFHDNNTTKQIVRAYQIDAKNRTKHQFWSGKSEQSMSLAIDEIAKKLYVVNFQKSSSSGKMTIF